MEDRDERPETYTIDPGEGGDLRDLDELAPEPRLSWPEESVPASASSLPSAPVRRPSHARIEGVEAGVAAGLVSPAVSDPAAISESSRSEAGAPALPDSPDGNLWSGDGRLGDPPIVSGGAAEATSPALPDWRDPPTREVPRVLLEHPLAAPGPAYPGPVWREIETDWDDDDLTFAEIVHEGASVADHGLGIDEPDPYAFDFAIESAASGVSRLATATSTAEPQSGSARGAPADEVLAAVQPTTEGVSRRPGRGVHRARVTFAGRVRRGDSGASAALPAHAPAPSPKASSKRNPVIATATGLAIGGAALLIFLAGPPAVLALVTVVLVVATAECYQALRRARYQPAVLVGLLAVVAVSILGYLKGPDSVAFVGAGFVIATLCWYLFGVTRRSRVANFGATLIGWLWVGMLGGFATLLLDPRVFPDRHGVAYLLGAIVATVAYDVGGYAFGSWLGSHRLAPSISPNKTWEGLLGGCFTAVAISVAIVHRMHPWTLAHALELGAVVAVFAPLGDLVESMVKRDIGVKDMGTLLPAHGGMLDRVDSLLFVLPATYCLVRLFHG